MLQKPIFFFSAENLIYFMLAEVTAFSILLDININLQTLPISWNALLPKQLLKVPILKLESNLCIFLLVTFFHATSNDLIRGWICKQFCLQCLFLWISCGSDWSILLIKYLQIQSKRTDIYFVICILLFYKDFLSEFS